MRLVSFVLALIALTLPACATASLNSCGQRLWNIRSAANDGNGNPLYLAGDLANFGQLQVLTDPTDARAKWTIDWDLNQQGAFLLKSSFGTGANFVVYNVQDEPLPRFQFDSGVYDHQDPNNNNKWNRYLWQKGSGIGMQTCPSCAITIYGANGWKSGTNVNLWDWHNVSNQQWSFVPA